MKRAVHLYDRLSDWLKAIDWALPIMALITIANLTFFVVTMDGCAMEPVSTFSQSGDQL